ncbi:MAG TPA: hypothetical protein VD931_14565 [Baekduia sp.]|nr:hypothetical protein [Baekduia sp.]
MARRHRHQARDAALLTLGLSVSSAVGYVAVASSRTRKRIRMAELRYGMPSGRALL